MVLAAISKRWTKGPRKRHKALQTKAVAATVEALAAAQARGTIERPRVLIIEQNRRTVGELHDRLVRMGYETEVALSGESGLAIIHERDMDLAVLDHRVSGFDEWELLHQLRRRAPGLPIVLIADRGTTSVATMPRTRSRWALQRCVPPPPAFSGVQRFGRWCRDRSLLC